MNNAYLKKPSHWVSALLGLVMVSSLARAAAPSTPQGLITGKAYLGISGTAITALTDNPKFPDHPDSLMFFPHFEWVATEDIFTPPANWSDNYGGQIAGYFYPPSTGEYIFWIAADDNAQLFLSPDSDPANKKLIAQETAWSNPREYDLSGGNSDLDAKDSSFFTGTQWETIDQNFGGAIITLQRDTPYYIEALFKEGGGGDNLSVAVQDPGGEIDITLPIPGEYLATDRTNGTVVITAQPQNQSADERGSASFQVLVDGTPPYTFQWSKDGEEIPNATELVYSISGLTVTDDGAVFSVAITGADGSITSDDAVLTVVADTKLPTVLGAKGLSSLTEVVLTFSEALDPGSAENTSNYAISSSAGGLNVTDATLSPDGTTVTLTTASQSLGRKYTILINNVQDTAAVPNTIAPDSKGVFIPTGKLREIDGFIIFEAENYDRNLDGIWVEDTERGNPSGGAAMVVHNGAGGNEANTRLEYDVTFEASDIYRVWYLASGNDGNDDSGWLYIDDERPFGREDGNSASMTGFSGALDYVWRSDSQDGPDPYTVDVLAGEATIALARREDGSFFDKFIFTTDMDFTPTGFGPPETREGAPGLPTITLTGPADGSNFSARDSITLTATGDGDGELDIARVEYIANGVTVAMSSTSPFTATWENIPDGIFSIRAMGFDEIGQSAVSDPITVTIGNPPPQALLVVGTASDPNLNASDAGIKARLESQGWQVPVVQAPASVTSDADGKDLVIVSSTVNSGDVGDKFRLVEVPVIAWEQAVQDNFLMTLDAGTDRGTLADQTEIEIINANHPLAGGLSAGIITATTSVQTYSWGFPNENAVSIATVVDNPDQVLIYGYEEGAILVDDSTPAPSNRVMFFWGDTGFENSTAEAYTLFDAAVEWASGIAPQGPEPTGANIAFISFHAADDEPTTAASDVGFTDAPDRGYTDLLAAAGHKVTRYVTSGNPEVGVLNAHDLVVISRSVPSGDYQDAPEAAAWNSVETPTLILGGYILRNSRLGFTTGGTMVDTAEPIKLHVNDPSHPIFADVSLDGDGMMINDYAGIITYNDIVQRGISINNDPPAGDGTILATVGNELDPAFGGLVIGEWQAGAAMSNGGGDTLAGHRVVLLTGSRELDITSQGAGIYDLTDDGAKLLLNAVNYMTGLGGEPVELSLSLTGGGGTITLTFTGKLQSASSLNGPWTDVASAASPQVVNTTGAMQFFRVVE